MEDKEIICKECGEVFTLTVEDQEFYANKGYAEPRRCLNCRRLRRQNIGKE